MKSVNDLLIEINAASRRTRDAALLALLSDLKEFLESKPPAHQEKPILEPREGRPKRPRRARGKMPEREAQIRKNKYMKRYMKERRHKQKEARLASPPSHSDRDCSQVSHAGRSSEPADADKALAQAEAHTQSQGKPPWEDE